MLTRVIILALCLIGGQIVSPAQTKEKSKPNRVRSVSLRQVGKYAEEYTPATLKLSSVVLEDFRSVENDWVHVFQLYDSRTKVRRGEKSNGLPYNADSFLICTDEEIGKPLLERKEKWLNHRVNVYLYVTDQGLTTHIYVGHVTKIELLDEKARVIDVISSKS